MEHRNQHINVELWTGELERMLNGTSAVSSKLLSALFSALILERFDSGFDFLRKQRERGTVSSGQLVSLAEDLLKGLLSGKRYKEAGEVLQAFESWNVEMPSSVLLEFAEAYVASGDVESGKRLLARIVDRNPETSGAIRVLYQLAKKEAHWEKAHRWLNKLIEADGTPGTVAFAFRERLKLTAGEGKSIRIAILSSYVLDNLTHHIDFECRKAGLRPEFYIAPFNQYSQDILNRSSGLYKFDPEIVFLAVGLDDLMPDISAGMSDEIVKKAGETIPGRILNLVKELQEQSSALIVVHEFHSVYRSPLGILDNRSESGTSALVSNLNRRLREELRSSARTFLFPLNEVLGLAGLERSYDPKLHYLASMRVSHGALPYVAQYSMRYIKPLKGMSRKCIVLDLDGTLWGGIVGEAGIDGIKLGLTAPGVEYVEFQRALAALAKKGVILAICSKNNREDVMPVLRTHKHMILREQHFGAMRINWVNKADNIRELARELNIGLDSMVFMDDNPVERELVRQVLPEVLTVEMPKDSSRYRLVLESMTDFELLAVTREDEMRGQQYQAMAQRQAIKNSSNSLEGYLRSLDIRAEIALAEQGQLPRLVQLFNKTNQFNLTTKRYQAVDVDKFHQSPDWRLYALSVKDRFGDHGLAGTALAHVEGRTWRIDSFLMSCRVMGLSVETVFLARICQDAMNEGVTTLRGEFRRTEKNQPAKDFYLQQGFNLELERDDCQEWVIDLKSSKIEKPDWIAQSV